MGYTPFFNKTTLVSLVFILGCWFPFLTVAQITTLPAGTIDPSFSASGIYINDAHVYEDGRILIVGNFTKFNGVSKSRIVRLNPDCSIDDSFQGSANREIFKVLVLNDGSFFMIGDFSQAGGSNRTRIAKFQPNGQTDQTFNAFSSANDRIYDFEILPDGKLLVAGGFTQFNSQNKSRIVRLQSNGLLDQTFNSTNSLSNAISDIQILPDSTLLISGYFNGNMVKMNKNGNAIASTIGSNFNSSVYFVQPLKTGKWMVSGNFTEAFGRESKMLVRLNSDLTLDETFTSTQLASQVRTVYECENASYLVGGYFGSPTSEIKHNYTTLLTESGEVDSSFVYSPSSYIHVIKPYAEDRFLIAGYNDIALVSAKAMERLISPELKSPVNGAITETNPILEWAPNSMEGVSYEVQLSLSSTFDTILEQTSDLIETTFTPTSLLESGKTYYWRVRASNELYGNGIWSTTGSFIYVNYTPGTFDYSFNIGTGFNGIVHKILPYGETSSVLVMGEFTQYKGVPVPYRVLLKADGSIDSSIVFKTFNAKVFNAAFLSDGKLMVVGDFTQYDGVNAVKIIRLNEDGTLDPSFTARGSQAIHEIAVDSLDRVYIGGKDMFTYAGVSKRYIARILSNGDLDNTFDTDAGFNYGTLGIKVLPNQKVAVSGNFSTYKNVAASGLIVLNDDGSVDTSFRNGVGIPSAQIYDFHQLETGKWVVGGTFFGIDGKTTYSIARLNADGSLDQTFNSFTNMGGSRIVEVIYPLADGTLLVGGSFSGYSGKNANFTRINPDGSVTADFNTGTGVMGSVYTMHVQEDGKILVGGGFAAYNGNPSANLARIFAEKAVYQIPVPIPLSPAVNASVPDMTPTFTWDAITGATGYDFRLATDMEMSTVVISEDNVTDASFTVEQPIVSQKDYYWSVRTRINEDLSSFSEPRKFSTTRLAAPVLITPAANDSNISVSPTFVWSKIEGADGYELRINIGSTVTPQIVKQLGTDTVYTYTEKLLNYQTYNWAVRAKDEGNLYGNSPQDGQFTTELGETFTPGNLDLLYKSEFESGIINAVIPQSDGKLLVAGDFFITIGNPGVRTQNLVRFHADGKIDHSFVPIEIPEDIDIMIQLASGKYLVAGGFWNFNGREALIRINSDGSLDESFNVGKLSSNSVKDIIELPDGKLMIAGSFTTVNENIAYGLARLEENGTFDPTFNAGQVGATNILQGAGTIHQLARQPDGKLLLGGLFNFYNGVAVNYFVRITADGDYDPTFAYTSGVILDIVVQPDGKILLSQVPGLSSGLVRLLLNGQKDPDFVDRPSNALYGGWLNQAANKIVLQPDGKILVTGSFNKAGSLTRNRVARLNTDGTPDETFDPQGGPDSAPYGIVYDAEGTLFIYGAFSTVNGTPRMSLAKLHNDECPVMPASIQLFAPENGYQTDSTWVDLIWNPISGASYYVLEVATDDTFETKIATRFLEPYETTARIADLSENQTYYWRVKAFNLDLEEFISNTRMFETLTSTSNELTTEAVEFALLQNSPNPFNPSTTIRYTLDKSDLIRLTIFDAMGRKVANLIHQHQQAGAHSVQFNASNLSSGIYFYRLESSTKSAIEKMLLIK